MPRRLRIMWGVVLPILAVMTCSIGYNIGVKESGFWKAGNKT